MVGDSGCGPFLGSWRANDELITISDIAFRLESCTRDVAEQAERILATFDDITDFNVRPAGPSLEDPSGIARLALVPAISLKDRN